MDFTSSGETGSFELSVYELPQVYESATYFGFSRKVNGVRVLTKGSKKPPGAIVRTRMASTSAARGGYGKGVPWEAMVAGYNPLASTMIKRPARRRWIG
jgi:hypothetical protein